jgi:hypothetical protein
MSHVAKLSITVVAAPPHVSPLDMLDAWVVDVSVDDAAVDETPLEDAPVAVPLDVPDDEVDDAGFVDVVLDPDPWLADELAPVVHSPPMQERPVLQVPFGKQAHCA